VLRCMEELRATNKHAWRVLMNLCNDAPTAEEQWEEPKSYQLTHVADDVGLSEENTYAALKVLSEFLSVSGICLHEPTLKRVCRCCRSFGVLIPDTVTDAVTELLS
jgi:hypothetical protein